jgi:hypothetical protein
MLYLEHMVAQVVECLSSKHEVLNSKPYTTKKSWNLITSVTVVSYGAFYELIE